MKKKIKIFQIIDSLGLGGAQRQLAALCLGLDPEKFEVHVVSLCGKLLHYKQDLEKGGIQVHVIEQQGKFSLKTLIQLKHLFEVKKPDIVHCWLFTAGLYGRLAAWGAGGAKTILGIRNTLYDMPFHYRIADSLLALGTNIITVNAESMQSELQKNEGIPKKKLRTIYNGIELKDFNEKTGELIGFKNELNIEKDSLLIAMIARMAEQKDHMTFLRGAVALLKEFPAVRFVLIGDGPKRAIYEDFVHENRCGGKIIFAGARRDVFTIINDVDICVLTTYSEGCSNVIMEAMAASKPVIASNVGGNAELVKHGTSGYIIGMHDEAGLTEGLRSLILDASKRKEMGHAGRKRAEKMLSLEKMISESEKMYRSLLSGKTEVALV